MTGDRWLATGKLDAPLAIQVLAGGSRKVAKIRACALQHDGTSPSSEGARHRQVASMKLLASRRHALNYWVLVLGL